MKFLAVCNHIGGLNALMPVINKVKISHEIIVLTNILNKEKFTNIGIPIFFLDHKIKIKEAKKFMINNFIDLLITSTSEPEDHNIGRLESIFVYSSKGLGIKSFVIIDSWQKYRERFSLSSSNCLEAIPTKIFTIDSKSKSGMIKNGFPKEKIIVTGNPAWEKLTSMSEKLKFLKFEDIYSKLKIKKSYKYIFFISQPISERQGYLKEYDEFKVLKEIIEVIKKLNNKSNEKFILFIKNHPSEKKDKYKKIVDQNKNIIFDWEIDGMNIYQLSKFAAVNIGMFSMLLKELELIGHRVLSFQPNLQNEQLIYTGINEEVVRSKTQLIKKIDNINTTRIKNKQSMIFNSSTKILELIGEEF